MINPLNQWNIPFSTKYPLSDAILSCWADDSRSISRLKPTGMVVIWPFRTAIFIATGSLVCTSLALKAVPKAPLPIRPSILYLRSARLFFLEEW